MNDHINETQPTNIPSPVEDTAPVHIEQTPPPKRKRKSGLKISGFVFLGLILVLAVSGLLGYQSGIQRRKNLEDEQLAIAAATQFELGLQDLEAGRYEVARQRFEYVINVNPTYPGVTDKLAEVLLVLSVTATPTNAPIPTDIPVTPTPDSRAEEDLFAQAESLIANKEWTQAIETLEQVRKKNPEFRAVDIDGMIYLALRQRGIQKVTAGNLEGGIYDLTQAEGFGILDTEADSYRTWARYYITGASFWDVDWPQAINYFEQVAAMTPNLHDGTGWTASQRYVDAIVGYGQQLESLGKYCDADEVYDLALQYTGDPQYQTMIDNAQANCK